MAELKLFLEEQDLQGVVTYIQSGNAIVQSALDAKTISQKIEKDLPKRFKLDSAIVKILTLSLQEFEAVVDKKPKGFGDEPDTYHSDAIFLMGIDAVDAMSVFNPREGVDEVWPGKGVIYSQRLSALRTKSRLSRIIGTLPYQSMTIRSWGTTIKLLDMAKNSDANREVQII